MTQQTYTPYWSKAPTDANWHWRDNDGPVLDHDAALDNWRDTLTVRPFQHRDIPQNLSDYFTGKTPFITAYVDLLLARMAKENRFSDDKGSFGSGCFDIVSFDYEGFKHFGISLNSAFEDGVIYLTCVICLDDTNFIKIGSFELNTGLGRCRTIIQAEAIEFRTAMEAVYG